MEKMGRPKNEVARPEVVLPSKRTRVARVVLKGGERWVLEEGKGRRGNGWSGSGGVKGGLAWLQAGSTGRQPDFERCVQWSWALGGNACRGESPVAGVAAAKQSFHSAPAPNGHRQYSADKEPGTRRSGRRPSSWRGKSLHTMSGRRRCPIRQDEATGDACIQPPHLPSQQSRSEPAVPAHQPGTSSVMLASFQTMRNNDGSDSPLGKRCPLSADTHPDHEFLSQGQDTASIQVLSKFCPAFLQARRGPSQTPWAPNTQPGGLFLDAFFHFSRPLG